MSHTPGLLRVELSGDHSEWLIKDEDSKVVAEIYVRGEEDKKNAHLLAAAPEMLEALEYYVSHDLPFDGLARRAIAKAKGEL